MIILKKGYRAEIIENKVWIIDVFYNEHLNFMTPRSLETSQMVSYLNGGIDEITDSENPYYKLILNLSLNKSNIFEVVSQCEGKRIQGYRRMLRKLEKDHHVSKERLIKYLSDWDEVKLYFLSPYNLRLADDLYALGFNKPHVIDVDQISEIGKGEKNILVLPHKYAHKVEISAKCCVFYDPQTLQLGPVYTFDNFLEKPEQFLPSCDHDATLNSQWILESLLVNVLFYLISDMYKELKTDVALPFRKIFALDPTSMLLSVQEAPMK